MVREGLTPLSHKPVMLREIIDILNPKDGGIYIDGTFGVGGYSRAFLKTAHCQVWAIDRDPDAVEKGRALGRELPQRFHIIHGRYGEMDHLLSKEAINIVDGVALDIGVSSPQLDQSERGFSFRKDAPLDMRMEKTGMSAADVVRDLNEQELSDIILRYGEERYAKRIARQIVKTRSYAPITRTQHLADVIRKVLPRSREKIDPATRTFQALRIYVNDELGELNRGLVAAERLLSQGGLIAVVTFHSLEDRCVKHFFRERSGLGANNSRHLPYTQKNPPTFRELFKKPLRPQAIEISQNPRARSARLRAAEKLSTSSEVSNEA
jgi:16S rRNA (cytosine1402-N4)-methyltransferase